MRVELPDDPAKVSRPKLLAFIGFCFGCQAMRRLTRIVVLSTRGHYSGQCAKCEDIDSRL